MENENAATSEQIISAAGGFWQQLDQFVRNLFLPHRLSQVAAVLALMVIAYFLARFLSPRLRIWLRKREGWPKWRLRLGLMIDRRLRLILFTAIFSVLIMALTYFFRSFILNVVFGKIEADVRAGGRFIGLGAGDVGMADDLPAALQRQLLEHAAHFAVSAQKYLHSAASCTGSPASRIMRFRRPRFSGAMGYIGIRKCPACRPIRFMAVFTGMGLTSMNRALMRSR